MSEVLGSVLVVAAVGALAAIVAYMLVFAAMALWTVRRAPGPDVLSRELEEILVDDLDRVLLEILGTAVPRRPGDR